MKRNSSMAVSLSAFNVDQKEKYEWPPEDCGAFRPFREAAAAAAVTRHVDVLPGAAHVDHWEKYQWPPGESGAWTSAHDNHCLREAAHVDHWEKYEWPLEDVGAFRDAPAVTNHDHDHHFPAAAHVDHWEKYEGQPDDASHDVGVFPGAGHFLQTCFLCNRRLRPHMDIYMYSDAAFCSPECRGEQILIHESNENCAAETKKMRESLLQLTIATPPRRLCPKNIGHYMEPRSYNDSFSSRDYNDNSDASFGWPEWQVKKRNGISCRGIAAYGNNVMRNKV